MDFALIGGTGVENLALQNRMTKTVETPFGSVVLETGRIGDAEMVFLKRHGVGHTVPPHRINYRGNIWAFKKFGYYKNYNIRSSGFNLTPLPGRQYGSGRSVLGFYKESPPHLL